MKARTQHEKNQISEKGTRRASKAELEEASERTESTELPSPLAAASQERSYNPTRAHSMPYLKAGDAARKDETSVLNSNRLSPLSPLSPLPLREPPPRCQSNQKCTRPQHLLLDFDCCSSAAGSAPKVGRMHQAAKCRRQVPTRMQGT
ncbi:unnamed protein product, partial [Symbiodinium pilosum]